jgi:hypothetical protein
VVASLAGLAGQGITLDSDQSFGLANAAPILKVLEDGGGLLLGQMRTEQLSALAIGEKIAARAAWEEAEPGLFAIATCDGEVFVPLNALIGTSGIQAAESKEVVRRPHPATNPAIRARNCVSKPG